MKVFVVSCMLLSVALAQAVPSGQQPSTFLQECFDKDSISCVQTTVRELFQNISFFFLLISFSSTKKNLIKCSVVFVLLEIVEKMKTWITSACQKLNIKTLCE